MATTVQVIGGTDARDGFPARLLYYGDDGNAANGKSARSATVRDLERACQHLAARRKVQPSALCPNFEFADTADGTTTYVGGYMRVPAYTEYVSVWATYLSVAGASSTTVAGDWEVDITLSIISSSGSTLASATSKAPWLSDGERSEMLFPQLSVLAELASGLDYVSIEVSAVASGSADPDDRIYLESLTPVYQPMTEIVIP